MRKPGKSAVWFIAVGVIAVCGCRPGPAVSTRPDSARQESAATTEAEKKAAAKKKALRDQNALKDHVGDFQLANLSLMTMATIPDLLTARDTGRNSPKHTVIGKNESETAWVVRKDGESARKYEVGIPIQMIEPQMTIQVGARLNLVQRGKIEQVVLGEHRVAGFWYPADGTQWLQVCCQTRVFQIRPVADAAADPWPEDARKRASIELAMHLLDAVAKKSP